MELRTARAEDLDEAARVMVAAYEQYAPLMPPGTWEQYAGHIADVRSRLDGSELLVAVEDGRVLGAVTFYADGTRSGEGWPAGYAAIRLLAVHPDGRGRGLGRLLMEECLRRSRALGVAYVGLHTTEMMAVAKAMYERMGFERVPEYDFTAGPGVTVLGYRLDL